MYRLQEQGPRWLTLKEKSDQDPAIEIQVAPYTRSLKRRAGAAARALFPDMPANLTEADPLLVGDFVDAVSRESLRLAILDWRGVGDANGKPVPVTPANVDMFLADEEMIEAADRLYLVPAAQRGREGNGSGGLPSGTSGADRPIAKAARPAARNAPTPSTPPKPPKAKKSGGS